MDSSFNVKTTDGEEVRIVRAYAADGSRPFESRVLEAEDGRTLRPLGGGMAEVIEILDDAVDAAVAEVKDVIEDGKEAVEETAAELVAEVKETVGDAVEAVGDAAGAALDSVQDALTGDSTEEEPVPGTKPEDV